MFNWARKFLGVSLTNAGVWGWALPGQWSKQDMIKQYTRVVYPVVSAIAEEAAKITYVVQASAEDETPIKKHPFLELMRRPNEDSSQFQFLELHFTFLKLVGEAYWYVVKNKIDKMPVALYHLRPDLMTVKVEEKNNPAGLVSYYEMNLPQGKKERFEKDEILHFKMPNPINPYYGMGTVEAGSTYIQTEKFTSEWTRNSIYNSGRPSGVLTIKGQLGEAQFTSLKKQFKEQYSGTQNAGKTMILKGSDGIDYQKLGMDLNGIALKELKDLTRDDIMMMFRVSKTMLGISEDVSLNNARESRVMFKENIILAEWDRHVDHLTSFFLPMFGTKSTGIINYKHPDLQSGTDKVTEWTQGHNKWLTTNDIRKERNLKPIPGGDVLYQALNLVPVVKESEKPKPLESQNPNTPDKNKPGEGKPQDQNNGDNPPKKGLKKKELTQKTLFEEQMFQIQEAWVPVYKKAMVKEFKEQEKEILGKNQKSTAIDWLFDIQASKKRIVGTLMPMGFELMVEASRFAFEIANDPDTELEVNERIRDYIHDRIERLATATNDQTVKAIEAEITEGIAEGENLRKLRDRISSVYESATTVRSELIARTEAIAASNEGALEAYRQSPLVTAKQWSANPGACEFCASFDGVVVTLEADFAAQGTTITSNQGGTSLVTYDDIEHPPLHPNCRCALLPVAEE